MNPTNNIKILHVILVLIGSCINMNNSLTSSKQYKYIQEFVYNVRLKRVQTFFFLYRDDSFQYNIFLVLLNRLIVWGKKKMKDEDEWNLGRITTHNMSPFKWTIINFITRIVFIDVYINAPSAFQTPGYNTRILYWSLDRSGKTK